MIPGDGKWFFVTICVVKSLRKEPESTTPKADLQFDVFYLVRLEGHSELGLPCVTSDFNPDKYSSHLDRSKAAINE